MIFFPALSHSNKSDTFSLSKKRQIANEQTRIGECETTATINTQRSVLLSNEKEK